MVAAPRIEEHRTPDAEARRHGRPLTVSATARFITVTPELAQVWLQRNRGNRMLAGRTVATYAHDMERGAWTLSSQAISFSVEGRLLNGQNRLHACIRAGAPFPALVLFGMQEVSFSNEDTQRRRSRKDRLDIQSEQRTQMLSAAMAWVHTWTIGRLDQVNLVQPSPDEERALLEKHPLLRDSVALVSRTVFKAVGSQPMLAGLHYICRHKDPILADAFFDALGTGEMLREGEPLYHLRKQMLTNRSAAARKFGRLELSARVLKAWNLTRQGRRDLQVFSWRNGAEPFPEVM